MQSEVLCTLCLCLPLPAKVTVVGYCGCGWWLVMVLFALLVLTLDIPWQTHIPTYHTTKHLLLTSSPPPHLPTNSSPPHHLLTSSPPHNQTTLWSSCNNNNRIHYLSSIQVLVSAVSEQYLKYQYYQYLSSTEMPDLTIDRTWAVYWCQYQQFTVSLSEQYLINSLNNKTIQILLR